MSNSVLYIEKDSHTIDIGRDIADRLFRKWAHEKLITNLYFQENGKSLKSIMIYHLCINDIFENLEVSA